MNLHQATAVVTGGAVRIGREIALRLAREGADVVVHFHSHEAEALKVVAEIQSLGRRAVAIPADLRSPPAAAESIFRRAIEELGSVNVLINSAAIFKPGSLAELTADQWQGHLAINLEAPVFLSREFAHRLPPETSGHIINIADWRGLRPQAGHLAYTVAKSGLVSLTQIAAQELGPRIQVNAIAPGAILPGPGETPETFETLGSRNPLRRTGSPAEVADAVVFLLRSEFITGQILHVTGGEELVVGPSAAGSLSD